jgi:hypothetical protein
LAPHPPSSPHTHAPELSSACPTLSLVPCPQVSHTGVENLLSTKPGHLSLIILL